MDPQPDLELSPSGSPPRLDPETLSRLHPRALPRTRSASAPGKPAEEGIERTTSSLSRASSDLKDQLKAALERTASGSLRRTSSAGAGELLSALHHTASGNFHEASLQAESAWERFVRGSLVHVAARSMVCLFFADRCLAKYRDWQFHQSDFMQRRIADYPHRYQDPGYPWFALLVLLPCVALTVLGVRLRLAAGVLFLDTLRESAAIIWAGLLRVVQHRAQPDELTTKRLAMLGAAALILAHAVRDRYATSNTVAGLLMGDPDEPPSHAKSAVLLACRLALALLFFTVGVSQAKRVIERDWRIYVRHEYFRPDGHDNSFLLAEALLAVPFAVGYRTRLVAPLLAATLLAEAAVCWSPLEEWNSVQYQSHVRSHFATNVGAAGGLLLLCAYGAGRYTVDGLLKRKRA